MSNNFKLSKSGFLKSLYEKLYMHKGILKISIEDNIIVPKEYTFEFIHDLGILVEEAFKENATLDK